MKDDIKINVDGHVKIWDPATKEVFVSKHNAINSENMSYLIGRSLAGLPSTYIYEMHFGNGGAIIDETGNITYKDVTTNLETGKVAGLFNPTYFKCVDKYDTTNNTDPDNNNVAVSHVEGSQYTDVIVTCTLAQNEPAGQETLDQEADFTGEFVFNELGLKAKDDVNTPAIEGIGRLLSQIVFHPVQKSKNRVIQVVYTLRIRIV